MEVVKKCGDGYPAAANSSHSLPALTSAATRSGGSCAAFWWFWSIFDISEVARFDDNDEDIAKVYSQRMCYLVRLFIMISMILMTKIALTIIMNLDYFDGCHYHDA